MWVVETLLLALLAAGPGDRAAPVTLLQPAAQPVPVLLAQAEPPAEAPPKPAAKPAPKAPQAPSKPAPAPASGMTPEVADLVERMQAFYEKTADFRADFEQKYTYTRMKRTQTSTGTVIFKKPGLMRWEYEKPSKKTFVLAGERVYAHDPDAQLLTRARIGTSQLSASVTFLWGQGRLAEEFAIAKKACNDCKGVLLELTPLQPDPRFKQILLEVDPKTAQVLTSTVIDPDGSRNAIRFMNLARNTGVDEAVFKLTPPEGTQVQDYLQQGQ
jgi:outer membrane lipoprotein carrier protein